MADVSYVEGQLYGKDRDPTLKWESLSGLDDERLGKLLRSLGKTASIYRETVRAAHCPPLDEVGVKNTEEERAAHDQKIDRFHRLMDITDHSIGKLLAEAIDYSNLDPSRMAMYSKSAIFKDGEPVLYWEHWGTDDLDDRGRDSVEFQMFVGLNDYLKTQAGAKLAHNVLDEVLDGSKISPSGVPSDRQTLGTVSPSVFIPFTREIPTD